MSTIIQPRTYSARDATIRQQRPSALIDGVEAARTPICLSVPVFRGNQTPWLIEAERPALFVTVTLTGATPYTLCDRGWPTTTFAVVEADPADALAADWQRWTRRAREALEQAAKPQRPAGASAASLRVERLAAVQATLGFTMQDLAAVLGLSRPQLYRWLDEAADVRMQESKRLRLATIELIAKAWQERSSAPLRAVAHEPLATGTTLFAQLSADAIDEAALRASLDDLAAKLQGQPKTLSQRLADAGFKRRPTARSLPSDE